jgi:REP element-mobilizing transposase RayT
MGRPLRIEFEDALYHIISRGNAREKIFIDKEDRMHFFAILKDYHIRWHAIYHCFALMDNHYHLLLETPGGNLSAIMHGINSRYTGYINRKYNRVGHLFQGRYKAILIEKDPYLLELNRYIHLNPVRAGICHKPEDYAWSSYKGYLKPSVRLPWIEYGWTLRQFHENIEKAIVNYKKFVEEGISEKTDSLLKKVTGGVILGSESFVTEIKRRLGDVFNDKEIVKSDELKGFIPFNTTLSAVAEYYGITIGDLRQRGKHNLPRKVALFLLYRQSHLSNKEIGALLGGIHYTAVSQAVHRFEKEIARNANLAKELVSIGKSLGEMSNVKT